MKAKPAEAIQVGELIIQVIRSARRKTLSLEVGHDGAIARAPERMRIGTIKQFVTTKYDWIERHLRNLPERSEPISLVDGAELKLFDQNLTLRVLLGQRGRIRISEQQLYAPLIQTHRPVEASLKDKLIRWYKIQARNEVRHKVTQFATQMRPGSKSPISIKVRDYKRRWGSCDHSGGLSFNWRIIMAPPSVIDYVVVHELAHLSEFNHSKRFWRIVEQQMPEWRKQQDWLAKHGSKLYTI